MSDTDPGIDATVEPTGDPTPGTIEDAIETRAPIDLDEIERDLRDVESALARLADGTYFADQPVAFVPGTNATGSTDSGEAAAVGTGS